MCGRDADTLPLQMLVLVPYVYSHPHLLEGHMWASSLSGFKLLDLSTSPTCAAYIVKSQNSCLSIDYNTRCGHTKTKQHKSSMICPLNDVPLLPAFAGLHRAIEGAIRADMAPTLLSGLEHGASRCARLRARW